MSRFTWAKRKNGAFNAARAFELRKAGQVYAVVQEKHDGWFSYGLHGCAFNTSNSPKPQVEAMAEALALVRQQIALKEKP
jgi:hypothetical protein